MNKELFYIKSKLYDKIHNAFDRENISQIKYYLDKFKQMNINIYNKYLLYDYIYNLKNIKILKFLISYGIDFNRLKNNFSFEPIYDLYDLHMIRYLGRFDKNIFYKIINEFNYLDISLSKKKEKIRIIKYLLSIGLKMNKKRYSYQHYYFPQNYSRVAPPYVLIINLDPEMFKYNFVSINCINNKNKYIMGYI